MVSYLGTHQTHVKVDTFSENVWEQHRVIIESEKVEFHISTYMYLQLVGGWWYVLGRFSHGQVNKHFPMYGERKELNVLSFQDYVS